MQTEFTCGIYTAVFNEIGAPKWFLKVNNHVVALIDHDGLLMHFSHAGQFLTQDMLIEIAVLMNNIKRQYKQLNNA